MEGALESITATDVQVDVCLESSLAAEPLQCKPDLFTSLDVKQQDGGRAERDTDHDR